MNCTLPKRVGILFTLEERDIYTSMLKHFNDVLHYKFMIPIIMESTFKVFDFAFFVQSN